MSWPIGFLGDLCQINIGRTPSRSVPAYWEGGNNPWLSISDMGTSKAVSSTKEGITDAAIRECNMRPVQAGTVLFSFKLSIGKLGIAAATLFTNEAIASLPILDRTLLCEDYLFHALQQVSGRLVGDRAAMGITLNKASLAQIGIPLPPLEEQRRIAAIMDKANEILNLRRKSVERIESLANSMFLEMFGNPFSTGSSHLHVPFREMTERITYGFTSPMIHEDSGIPILTAKNIRDGFIDLDNIHYARQDEFDALTSKCKPSPGDILITKDGSIGRCAIVPAGGAFCINQSVALVMPDRSRVTPEYVSAYIRCAPVQQRIQRMGKGNALKHLQITELADFPSVIPLLEDQKRFADLMATVNQKIDKSKSGVAEAEKMIQSLCFSLFESSCEKRQDRSEEPDS
jgi:type I restriction enzyme S subunit